MIFNIEKVLQTKLVKGLHSQDFFVKAKKPLRLIAEQPSTKRSVLHSTTKVILKLIPAPANRKKTVAIN